MKILLIEDELPAIRRLKRMIKGLLPAVEVLGELDSVEEAVEWFKQAKDLDLIFMDIQLADGLSFEIFEQCEINTPVIFTTAYDDYTLKAFKTNSVDYLLKPINPEELKQAIDKFKKIHLEGRSNDGVAPEWIKEVWKTLQKPNYKERFMVKQGAQFTFVKAEDIAWFYSEDSLVVLTNKKGQKFVIEGTLEKMMPQLDEKSFFQVNRNRIVHIEAIKQIIPISNNRLMLETTIEPEDSIYVSRARVGDFKEWLG